MVEGLLGISLLLSYGLSTLTNFSSYRRSCRVMPELPHSYGLSYSYMPITYGISHHTRRRMASTLSVQRTVCLWRYVQLTHCTVYFCECCIQYPWLIFASRLKCASFLGNCRQVKTTCSRFINLEIPYSFWIKIHEPLLQSRSFLGSISVKNCTALGAQLSPN